MASWRSKLALLGQWKRRRIAEAKLNRRQMLRLGLVAAGGAIAARQGIGGPAAADDGSLNAIDGISPSPISVPFSADLPQLQAVNRLKQPVAALNPAPAGFTWTHGTLQKTDHKLFSVNPDGTFGPGAFGNYPPQKFYELHVKQAPHNFSPGTPGWGDSTIWGFDGMFPGPLFREKYGVSALVRFYNDLPKNDPKSPFPFGSPEISTHLHNGHTPTESDGNPLDFFASVNNLTADDVSKGFHGFKDQHYPNVYAGFSTIKKGDPNGSRIADGDPNEALGSLWYHDHRVGFTAANVYSGLAGCYDLFDDVDTGDETTGLRLPSGDYDVPIMFLDMAFAPAERNASGTLRTEPVFDIFNTDGILGDKFTANGIIQPRFPVKQRRYRLRLLNIGPSRWYEFWLTDGKKFIAKPFWQISSDGNLRPHPIQVDNVRMAVAERVDIIVDFTALRGLGSQLFLVNRLEQKNGRGPTGNLLPISQATQIIRFDIGDPAPDASVAPSAEQSLRPLPAIPSAAALAKLTHRGFDLARGNGAWQINGKFFEFDADYNFPTSDLVPEGTGEVWTLKNGGGGWAHPDHIHFEEFQVLTLNGQPPPATMVGRKDVAPLGPGDELKIFIRLRDMTGRYLQHCHNVLHEDHAMMTMFEIVPKKGAGS
jgi:FtsP/CotA-like multicopper oxidase with cupredoxin domain